MMPDIAVLRKSLIGFTLAALAVVMAGQAASAAEADQCLVALDIGHDRKRWGSTSARGVPEWEFNIALGRRVRKALTDAGIKSVLMNPDGESIALRSRPKTASSEGATLLVSLHHDSAQPKYLSSWEWEGKTRSYSNRFSGFSLFVSQKNTRYEESEEIARAIADSLLAEGLTPTLHHAEAIEGENRPLLDSGRGIYLYDDLVVLKYARIPAVLVESGIIINRTDETVLASDTHRDKIARSVVSAAREICERTKS